MIRGANKRQESTQEGPGETHPPTVPTKTEWIRRKLLEQKGSRVRQGARRGEETVDPNTSYFPGKVTVHIYVHNTDTMTVQRSIQFHSANRLALGME